MKIYFFSFIIIGLALCNNVRAETTDKTCGKQCHENPQFKKEDKLKLAKCVQCHSPSVHKNQIDALNFKASVSVAEAATISAPNKDCGKIESGCAKPVESMDEGFSGMAFIPEGEFIMGTDDRLKDEKPAHVVYGKSFYIDIFEVTNGDYKNFIEKTGYKEPEHWINRSYPEKKKDHPVTFVSWHDAANYCKWKGKRLPREWEWEKGARGTDGRVYPWGNKWDMRKTNNPLRALGDTQPVGSYEEGKSPYGLYDMSGNVWEWVDEHYHAHPGSDYVNPEFGTKYRLLKGGSYWDCSFYSCGISAPVFNRAFFEPEVKGESYGFRCAKDPQPN